MAPSVQETQTHHSTLTPSQTNAQHLLSLTDSQPPSDVLNRRTYMASVTHITYCLNCTMTTNNQNLSLIDCSANGGLSGDDVQELAESTTLFANIKGFAEAEVKDVPLCTVAGVIQANSCPVIGLFHQYAHYGKGQTIHSPVQLEHFGLHVDDECAALCSS